MPARKLLLCIASGLLLVGCQDTLRPAPVVIWVSGGLRGDWLPHADYGQPLAGGLSRLDRALELYRRPNDLLVDLGRFRYPHGVSGETRRWRIKAGGFLKALTRLQYTAVNASLFDLPTWPPELAARAREYDLPLISANIVRDSLLFGPEIRISRRAGVVRFIGLTGGSGEFADWISTPAAANAPVDTGTLTILLTDAPEKDIADFCDHHWDVSLILWLNEGAPPAREIAGIPALGLGSEGNWLGRVEIVSRRVGQRIRLADGDLSGWLDGRPFRHHPARESLLAKLQFWRNPVWRAYLWEIPEEISPQKQAEAQRRQTSAETERYAELEEIHQRTPTDFAGPQRCLSCHSLRHRRDLAQLHLHERPPQVRDYAVFERCLPCHATGFDDPAGFLLPEERPDLLTVGCEACHGGGYQHSVQGQSPYPPIPDDTICQNCHNPQALPSDHPTGTKKGIAEF